MKATICTPTGKGRRPAGELCNCDIGLYPHRHLDESNDHPPHIDPPFYPVFRIRGLNGEAWMEGARRDHEAAKEALLRDIFGDEP